MKINFSNIHVLSDCNEVINMVKTFMANKDFLEMVPEEYIPELSGIDYNNIEEKNLRFFILTKSTDGWTGIFEDGPYADKDLAQFISKYLSCKILWICCSGSYCDYLYTMFENGIIIEDFARGDAYDYDDRGQLKYFECYNEEKMVQDLLKYGISTSNITYEDIMSNFNSLNLNREDLIHIGFKRNIILPKEFPPEEDDMETGEEKQGLFNKMMERLAQPLWDKLGRDMEQIVPCLQKAQELNSLASKMMQAGLKGEDLRNHPDYQKIVDLEKEITDEIRKTPYYTEEMEGMIKSGMGIKDKLLKTYDPLEEEINKLNSCEDFIFEDFAGKGRNIIDLISGIKIDYTDKSIKRLDKALSWSVFPEKLDKEKFKIAIGSLIGEILIRHFNGEWIKGDTIQNSRIKINDSEINPFEWYEGKMIDKQRFVFYENFNNIKQ